MNAVVSAPEALSPEQSVILEAMKMQTTIYAPCAGVVEEIDIKVSDVVESKDLLMKLRTS